MTRRVGRLTLVAFALAAAAAPWLAPNGPADQFPGYLNAGPSRVRVVDAQGRWHAPFVYARRVTDRLASRYEDDRSARITIHWLHGGHLWTTDPSEGPLLLLGADRLGRDVFARLLYGARASLGVALVGTLGALLLGVIVGGLAGYAGGTTDAVAMQVADFVLMLPAVYVVLAFRASLPLVLGPGQLFLLVAVLLALVGWPMAARGVRAIVAAERRLDHVEAARSLGAGHLRLLLWHLLPAARGYLGVQATLLVPAFILAEATLSYVGLGFVEPTPSWGTMLLQAGRNVRDLASFPWLLSPALAIVVVALAVHLVTAGRTETQVLWRPRAGR
jgi:peptide/nickel transport system permease protein